jgi:transposase InsO family protein
MRERFEDMSLHVLCKWFGISRQAYYQHERFGSEKFLAYGALLDQVRAIRKRHPRLGVRKLHGMLGSFMRDSGIKMGRDGLFDLLSAHGLLVRVRRCSMKTTHSHHWLKKYPNLTTGFTSTKPNELWVSDITYWKVANQPAYLSLITDAYSRKIVGYHLSENLHAEQTTKALKMALSGLGKRSEVSEQLIHHSDRGTQYCSSLYVSCLKKSHIKISMTQSGDPLENAIAERINGIIKDEYLLNYKCSCVESARKQLAIAVSLYNNERPHNSLGNLTPEVVHNQHHLIRDGKIRRLWKNYHRKNGVFANSMQNDMFVNFNINL